MNSVALTSLQASFLNAFFAESGSEAFFLTGGTGLSAFHLHHRVSVDLDLFTLDDLAFREASLLVPRLAADLNCQVGRSRRTEHYCEFLLEPSAGEPLRIDLVRDFGPQYGEHITVGNVIVDSIENIGANKLTAILSRTEAKDFVDLYFILRAGYQFDDLMHKAQAKDMGLQPFYLAGAMLMVRDMRLLPATTPPIALSELQHFIVGLANHLLDSVSPPQGSSPMLSST
jgi:hypothetical protein